MQLTPHFSRKELENSLVASQEGIDNTIPDELLPKAIYLCQQMEKVRELLSNKFGKETPLNITSGYRCPTLNSHPRVGGQKTSQHMKMEAIDFLRSSEYSDIL